MRAAFFDLDGTLCTGHVWKAIAQHHIQHRQKLISLFAYLAFHFALWPLYRVRLLSQERFFISWAKDLAWTLGGLTREEALKVFRWVVDRCVVPSFRPDILEVLHGHRTQGHLVVLVSGTFQDLLTLIGEELGLGHVVGTRLQVVDARYSGRIIEPACLGPGKVELLQDFLGASQLDVDLGSSFAYTDSIFDVPLLRLVGHPVAVYPDEGLQAYALREGWQILGG